ncbi:hypothetical protein HFO98_31800 [Rhizobium leguminosarum]|uniref:hypothetical protein n=1 Tax=Rhizobium leguminosarum TaxID=384 RepID=UPI001C979854|nr:hypothetical protein [Rhizobium leguminosarum]MBY5412931.1 hypothetical protein [Rhizobium leguminosarum]
MNLTLAGNHVVIGDQDESPLGFNYAHFVASTPLWQALLDVHTTNLMDDDDDLGGGAFEISDHFTDERAHDAFLSLASVDALSSGKVPASLARCDVDIGFGCGIAIRYWHFWT